MASNRSEPRQPTRRAHGRPLPRRVGGCILVLLIALGTSGCGRFMAARLVQAPNTYPEWFAPNTGVELEFRANYLTNWPSRFAEVGPPPARLRYRIIEPGDYQVQFTVTNWVHRGRPQSRYTFSATLPTRPRDAAPDARGTVLLLGGYGMGQFGMAPWALHLAEAGWRCVLVDLRGHGRSTGNEISYGIREAHDLSQLLDQLPAPTLGKAPLRVLGYSYGAALALRWKAAEPRLGPVVAIAPYAQLAPAVLNVRHDYAAFIPKPWLKAGLRALPRRLGVSPECLDPVEVLTGKQVPALFIASTADTVVPADEVRRLRNLAASPSRLLTINGPSHEALLFAIPELSTAVLDWLNRAPDRSVTADDSRRLLERTGAPKGERRARTVRPRLPDRFAAGCRAAPFTEPTDPPSAR